MTFVGDLKSLRGEEEEQREGDDPSTLKRKRQARGRASSSPCQHAKYTTHTCQAERRAQERADDNVQRGGGGVFVCMTLRRPRGETYDYPPPPLICPVSCLSHSHVADSTSHPRSDYQGGTKETHPFPVTCFGVVDGIVQGGHPHPPSCLSLCAAPPDSATTGAHFPVSPPPPP